MSNKQNYISLYEVRDVFNLEKSRQYAVICFQYFLDLEVAQRLIVGDAVQVPGDVEVGDQEALRLEAEDLEVARQGVVADLEVHRLNAGNGHQHLSQQKLMLTIWAEMLQKNIFKKYFHTLEPSEML